MEPERDCALSDVADDDTQRAVARLVEHQALILEELRDSLTRAAARMAAWHEATRHAYRQPRNERQRLILEIPDLLKESGIGAQEIDDLLGLDDLPHTRRALRMLERYGVIMEVEEGDAHWRLTPAYRFDPIVKSLAAVPCGHWTTTADVAIAVRGRLDFVTVIDAFLRASPVAPNWWRITEAPGIVMSRAESRSRDDAEQRLAAEGCLADDGTLKHSAKLDWSWLTRLPMPPMSEPRRH